MYVVILKVKTYNSKKINFVSKLLFFNDLKSFKIFFLIKIRHFNYT